MRQSLSMRKPQTSAQQVLELHGSTITAAANGTSRVINVRPTVEKSELARIAAEKFQAMKAVQAMVDRAMAAGQMQAGDIDEKTMSALRSVSLGTAACVYYMESLASSLGGLEMSWALLHACMNMDTHIHVRASNISMGYMRVVVVNRLLLVLPRWRLLTSQPCQRRALMTGLDTSWAC